MYKYAGLLNTELKRKTLHSSKILKMLPITIFILNFLVFYPIGIGLQSQSTSIQSFGAITYSNLGFHVNGRQIMDFQGNPIKLKGFSLKRVDVFKDYGMPITIERMQQIKGWGFNVINLCAFWGADIELSEDQPGIYNEANLIKIENVIQMADQAGLYVIFSMRIHHEYASGIPSWQGWPTTYKMMDDPSVRQRFIDLWEMLIQRFDSYTNLIGYNWWFFPFHKPPWGTRILEEVDWFYDTLVPELLETTRKHTNKIIFFTPYKQASIREYQDGVSEILDSGEFLHIEPIADDNVVYCHGWHKPYYVEWVGSIEYDASGNRIPWDYDINYLRRQLQRGIDFANVYNVPMMVTEMGMHTHNFPDVQEFGEIAQDRLDCYEAKMSLLDQYEWNILYWTYTNGGESGVLGQGTYDPYLIVDVFRNHIP